MRFITAAAALLASCGIAGLGGCVAPPRAQPTYQVVASLTQERDVLRKDLAERTSKRSNAKMQDDIDRLNGEIRDLEERIASLNVRITAEEARARTQPSTSALPSGCYVGPNGGRYTLTKSGKKNYGGC